MATNYIMGQYRYTGSQNDSGGSECCSTVFNTYPNQDNDASARLKAVYANIEGSDSYYQDVLIPFNQGNIVTVDDMFYINMSVAPSGMADTTYTLKLVKSADFKSDLTIAARQELEYEAVATFVVPKTSAMNMEAVGVSLYVPYGGGMLDTPVVGRIKADPWDTLGSLTLTNGVLYDANGNKISYHNSIYLTPTWQTEVPEGIRYEYSSFVGSKYSNSEFDALLLEIEREEVDKSVLTSTNGRMVMGRYLDVSTTANHLDVEILKVEKILPLNKTTVKQVGVWGRSGLPLILNGEEIKIGPSGYFELKDFDLTSIGVLANGVEDKFTIDYLYEKN